MVKWGGPCALSQRRLGLLLAARARAPTLLRHVWCCKALALFPELVLVLGALWVVLLDRRATLACEALSWISNESSPADLAAVRAAVDAFVEDQTSAARKPGRGELPLVDAQSLAGPGAPERLLAHLKAAPMGALAITGAFEVPERISWEWVSTFRESQGLSNHFVNGEVAFSSVCAGEPNITQRNRQRLLSPSRQHFECYFKGSRPTDYYLFKAMPFVEKDYCSLTQVFSRQVLHGSNWLNVLCGVRGGRSFIGPELARVLEGGKRPLVSIGRNGTAINFHHHDSTWSAMLRGRKAWWLGPPRLRAFLQELGSNKGGRSACHNLQARPHPDVALFVQEPGDILIFGESVAHATCNIEPSISVGSQMGYYRTPYMGMGRPGSTSCFQDICRDDLLPECAAA